MVLSLYSLNKHKMKKVVEIKDVIITDAVGIYTFQFEDSLRTEFDDFMLRYRDIEDKLVRDDFNRIVAMIAKISKTGAYERLFRTNEGRMNDNVVAIPLDILPRRNHDTLRLYCVRLSDRILIIGNGGTKRGRYNDNPAIVKCTKDLANLERAINYYIRQNKISLEYNKIVIDEGVSVKI